MSGESEDGCAEFVYGCSALVWLGAGRTLPQGAGGPPLRWPGGPPPPDPEVYRGRGQIRQFLEGYVPGFHVESSDVRGTNTSVTWRYEVAADKFRQMGIDLTTGAVEAVLQGGKIRSFTATFSQETVARIMAAMEAAQRTQR